jgi:hypothetical protein
MERDMHCTDKSMLTMPRPKEILQRVKSIQLLGPSIHSVKLVLGRPSKKESKTTLMPKIW